MLLTGFVCLLWFNEVFAPFPSCRVGEECSSCPDNKVKTFQYISGDTTRVCCPGCSSQYISFGYTRIRERAYCNCDFIRVHGSASKGEECSAPGKTTYTSLNGMPICCSDPLVVIQASTGVSGEYIFNCEHRGNCWRGSQCQYCNQSSVSHLNDVSVCCPNCENGLDIGGNNYCYCSDLNDSVPHSHR